MINPESLLDAVENLQRSFGNDFGPTIKALYKKCKIATENLPSNREIIISLDLQDWFEAEQSSLLMSALIYLANKLEVPVENLFYWDENDSGNLGTLAKMLLTTAKEHPKMPEPPKTPGNNRFIDIKYWVNLELANNHPEIIQPYKKTKSPILANYLRAPSKECLMEISNLTDITKAKELLQMGFPSVD